MERSLNIHFKSIFFINGCKETIYKMPPLFNPHIYGPELIYTTLIALLCFMVYFKTKTIYDLTKHKGIGYFRNAFLLFGLSYITGFLLYIFTLTSITFDFFMPRKSVMPFFIVVTGYLSTMAIFYLAYSTVWKKFTYDNFMLFANLAAVLVSAAAFISRSNIMLSMLQLILLVFTIIISTIKHKKGEKLQIRFLYILVSIFWLINLFLIGPRRLLTFQGKILFQVVSMLVFVAIYYKVAKWIK
jgi:hypothetical protein